LLCASYGKWGLIDKKRKEVYPFTVDLVRPLFYNSDYPLVFLINGKWIEAQELQTMIKKL